MKRMASSAGPVVAFVLCFIHYVQCGKYVHFLNDYLLAVIRIRSVLLC